MAHPVDQSSHRRPIGGGTSANVAFVKELTKARAMTPILAERANEKRAAGEVLIRDEADDLLCQSWNERMWPMAGQSIPP